MPSLLQRFPQFRGHLIHHSTTLGHRMVSSLQRSPQCSCFVVEVLLYICSCTYNTIHDTNSNLYTPQWSAHTPYYCVQWQPIVTGRYSICQLLAILATGNFLDILANSISNFMLMHIHVMPFITVVLYCAMSLSWPWQKVSIDVSATRGPKYTVTLCLVYMVTSFKDEPTRCTGEERFSRN